MISKRNIEDLIREGRLSITYSFEMTENHGLEFFEEEHVDPDNQNSRATRIFNKNFFGDRLQLTLGPIVKSHNPEHHHLKNGAFKHDSCFDLRETGNAIVLEAGESLSIATVERVRVDGTLAAITIPRLSLADSGLVYTTSYIDPHWDGILQGFLVNVTSHRVRLVVCEAVAVCRFYKISGDVDNTLRERFPRKSGHFGNNWHKILAEDGDPFPRKKKPLQPIDNEITRHSLSDFAKKHETWFKAMGYLAGIGSLIAMIGRLWAKTEDIEKLKDKADSYAIAQQHQNVELKTIQDELKAVKTAQPYSGQIEITIPANEANYTHKFEVSRSPSDSKTAWAALTKASPRFVNAISARIEGIPNRPESINIIIQIEVAPDKLDRQVDIVWLVAK